MAMKIYKVFGILLLCAVIGLSGCGQKQTVADQKNPQQKQAQPEKQVSLSILYSGENVNWVATIEDLAESFMREHPNIVLNMETSDTGIYTETLKVKEATDEFPDIFEIQDPYTFQQAGKLGEMPASVSNLVVNPVTIGGKVYAVPLYTTTYGIIYNQVLFKKYNIREPKTYDDFLKLCEQLKSLGVTPLAVGGSDSDDLNYWLNYFFQSDVISNTPDWQEKRNQKQVSFQNAAPVKMMQDYKSLMTSPYILEDSINMNDNQLVSKLIDGDTAMIYAGTSMLSQIIDAYPEAGESDKNTLGEDLLDSQVKCRVGWFFMPDKKGDSVAVNKCGAQWAISKDCEQNIDKRDAAALFLQYFYSTINYRKALQVMYAIPTTKEAILYPAAGVQQRLLVNYRYAAKSESYFGNNETPEWFTASMNQVLKSVATDAMSVGSAVKKLDAIWDDNEK